MQLLIVALACALFRSALAQTEILVNNGFESAFTNNWYCKGCTAVTSPTAYEGKASFQTSKRSAEWSGPAQKLSMSQVALGKEYRFQAYVKLLGTAVNEPLKMTTAYSLQDGTIKFVPILYASQSALDGWKLLGAFFRIEAQAQAITSVEIYIEGPKAAVDFLVDATSLKEVNWKDEALKRIESIRKRDVQITINTAGVADNVKVKIAQKKHHFGFGTAVDSSVLQSNAKYRQYFLDNFEWAVLENDMKWWANEGTRGQLTFGNADAAMKILEQYGKPVRGHTVFWADKTTNPSWVQQLTGNDLANVCWKRVDDLVGRYAGRIKHWDVNNEMLPNKFYEEAYGSKQINYDMFKKVNAKDKSATLFLNDYNVFASNQRTDLYLAQAQEFLSAGAPLGGIGVQGHFGSRQAPSELLARLDKLAIAGLPIWVTELDFTDASNDNRAVALEEILTVAFSHPRVEGILFWGFWDQRHWRGANAALVNGDNLQPNAAGLKWQQLYHKSWSTNTEISVPRVTNTHMAMTRVFHGTYDVTVSVNGATVSQTTLQVPPGSAAVGLTLAVNPTTAVVG